MLVNLLPLPLPCETGSWCSLPFTKVSASSTNVDFLQLNPSSGITALAKFPLKKRFFSLKFKLLATTKTQNVIQEDEHSDLWDESKQLISTFSFTAEESDLILKKAYGWIHSPYWGEERRQEHPQLDSIKNILDYLKSLSLSEDDLHKIMKKFPEVLGCCLDKELKANVETLAREWGIKGKMLRNLLLRNPKVLGYNVDCKGDCMAKCTRCWVRF